MKNNLKEIEINKSFIKLGEFLKLACVCATGEEAKLLIINSKVKLNGEICTMRGKKLTGGDIVSVNNMEYMVKYEADSILFWWI